MKTLTAPFTEEQVRRLKVGDMIEIKVLIYTGQDAVN